jgi:hypothetical protein
MTDTRIQAAETALIAARTHYSAMRAIDGRISYFKVAALISVRTYIGALLAFHAFKKAWLMQVVVRARISYELFAHMAAGHMVWLHFTPQMTVRGPMSRMKQAEYDRFTAERNYKLAMMVHSGN